MSLNLKYFLLEEIRDRYSPVSRFILVTPIRMESLFSLKHKLVFLRLPVSIYKNFKIGF